MAVIHAIARIEIGAVDRYAIDALPGGRNAVLLSVAEIVVGTLDRCTGSAKARDEVTGLQAVAGVTVITDDGRVDALTVALVTAVGGARVVVVAGFGQVGAISSRVTRILRARIVVVTGRERRLIEAGPGVFATTLCLILGFGLLALSGFQINAWLGLMTAIVALIALLFDFLFIPGAMILWEEYLENKSPKKGKLPMALQNP